MDNHQHIVVTGGSTGIGAAICAQFLEKGVGVINLARRPLELKHPALTNITIDLSDREATRRVAAKIADRFEITGLVHNAGLIRADLVEAVDLADLDYLTQVHLGAAISLTQAVLPGMKARHFGRIILITSRAALGLQTRTSYSATKAGMMAMARTWALELGGDGITVNTVAPGPIADTEMFTSVTPVDSPKADALAASIPVKRLGRSSDVAAAVTFLAGADAGFITGQTLMVCGGASLGSLAL
ncbi:short-chain dehydrogenase/reductase SDR [Luminiphilus syltensis NOR5-1B]|uniref:Short-chain dehydrogenase/reductase SDR n=1 Tax=Luminiphilus syltensis NOR5-1B TaxID=565045 RepID=B8KTB8_9GAMM|nr:SDR family oxidoreductase [Luminiphilus syltensis]EED34789.1 short-chain dehydrogenase/reductase SDR [Luminiphilus syltensis NOR5-1B]